MSNDYDGRSPQLDAYFCVCCFVSADEASLPHICLGCGATGSTIVLKLWQVKEIKRNGRHVGDRNSDDDRLDKELRILRSLQITFWGRDAVQIKDGLWEVTQLESNGTARYSVTVKADSKEEALKKTKTDLPYVEGPIVTIID